MRNSSGRKQGGMSECGVSGAGEEPGELWSKSGLKTLRAGMGLRRRCPLIVSYSCPHTPRATAIGISRVIVTAPRVRRQRPMLRNFGRQPQEAAFLMSCEVWNAATCDADYPLRIKQLAAHSWAMYRQRVAPGWVPPPRCAGRS